MKFKSSLFFSTLACLSTFSSATMSYADTITLNSGEIAKGVITRYSKYVTEIYSRGGQKTIENKYINSLVTDNSVIVTLDNGEK